TDLEFRPTKVVPGWDDELACRKAALDRGTGMNLQTAHANNFSNEPAFNDRITDHRVGVHDIAFFLQDKPAVGPEVFGNGLGDRVIAQVHVAAATLAHRGLGRGGHLEFSAALKADDRL